MGGGGEVGGGGAPGSHRLTGHGSESRGQAGSMLGCDDCSKPSLHYLVLL